MVMYAYYVYVSQLWMFYLLSKEEWNVMPASMSASKKAVPEPRSGDHTLGMHKIGGTTTNTEALEEGGGEGKKRKSNINNGTLVSENEEQVKEIKRKKKTPAQSIALCITLPKTSTQSPWPPYDGNVRLRETQYLCEKNLI